MTGTVPRPGQRAITVPSIISHDEDSAALNRSWRGGARTRLLSHLSLSSRHPDSWSRRANRRPRSPAFAGGRQRADPSASAVCRLRVVACEEQRRRRPPAEPVSGRASCRATSPGARSTSTNLHVHAGIAGGGQRQEFSAQHASPEALSRQHHRQTCGGVHASRRGEVVGCVNTVGGVRNRLRRRRALYASVQRKRSIGGSHHHGKCLPGSDRPPPRSSALTHQRLTNHNLLNTMPSSNMDERQDPCSLHPVIVAILLPRVLQHTNSNT